LGVEIISVETRHAVSIQKIDVSTLPIGVYILKIGNYTQKFMVVR